MSMCSNFSGLCHLFVQEFIREFLRNGSCLCHFHFAKIRIYGHAFLDWTMMQLPSEGVLMPPAPVAIMSLQRLLQYFHEWPWTKSQGQNHCVCSEMARLTFCSCYYQRSEWTTAHATVILFRGVILSFLGSHLPEVWDSQICMAFFPQIVLPGPWVEAALSARVPFEAL